MQKNRPAILLSFDVEEFDLPLEYKQLIEPSEQLEIGKKGLDNITAVLKEQDITSTFFVTGRFAGKFANDIQHLSERHEIASHSFYHSTFNKEDLLNSRLLLEKITNKNVRGFRMPRMKEVNMQWLKEAGYTYDASVNPTYIPGRYNNFKLPRTIYYSSNMLRLPCAVTPNLRIPLFWLSFKNLPYAIFKRLALQTLQKDSYLSLYFHPWEFTDISKFNIPFFVKRQSGAELTEKLRRLINDLKHSAAFENIGTYLNV
jgi:peptidoglycan/xylan/chitin deacetylase (PgdA/CDA1 family)